MCEIQSHRTLHDVADCANAWHGSTQHTQRLQPRPRAAHTIYKRKNGSSTAWMAQVAEKRPACSQRWHTIRAAHWSRIAKPHRFGPSDHQSSINQSTRCAETKVALMAAAAVQVRGTTTVVLGGSDAEAGVLHSKLKHAMFGLRLRTVSYGQLPADRGRAWLSRTTAWSALAATKPRLVMPTRRTAA